MPVGVGPVDAGPVDAGPVDAGPVDAGPVDAGPVDAGGSGSLTTAPVAPGRSGPRHRAGSRTAADRRHEGTSDVEIEQWQPRAVMRRRRRQAKRRRLLEWPILVAVALGVALVLRTFVVQSFWIPSGSMNDTLVRGDRVIVDKLSYDLHGVRRDDVVVFRRPANVQISEDDLIKRVIGLPGDVLQARDGVVSVNGTAVSEPFVLGSCGGTANFGPVTVPRDDVFVMGDNRCDSYDSRYFGPISQQLIVGHAVVLVWPPARWSGL